MSLTDTLAADFADILAQTDGPGESCAVARPGLDSVTVLAVVERLGLTDDSFEDARANVARAVAHLPRATLPTLPLETTVTDAAGAVWKVKSILAENAAIWTADLALVSRTAIGAPEDRHERATGFPTRRT